jgi:hypothetical protein
VPDAELQTRVRRIDLVLTRAHYDFIIRYAGNAAEWTGTFIAFVLAAQSMAPPLAHRLGKRRNVPGTS